MTDLNRSNEKSVEAGFIYLSEKTRLNISIAAVPMVAAALISIGIFYGKLYDEDTGVVVRLTQVEQSVKESVLNGHTARAEIQEKVGRLEQKVDGVEKKVDDVDNKVEKLNEKSAEILRALGRIEGQRPN